MTFSIFPFKKKKKKFIIVFFFFSIPLPIKMKESIIAFICYSEIWKHKDMLFIYLFIYLFILIRF